MAATRTSPGSRRGHRSRRRRAAHPTSRGRGPRERRTDRRSNARSSSRHDSRGTPATSARTRAGRKLTREEEREQRDDQQDDEEDAPTLTAQRFPAENVEIVAALLRLAQH